MYCHMIPVLQSLRDQHVVIIVFSDIPDDMLDNAESRQKRHANNHHKCHKNEIVIIYVSNYNNSWIIQGKFIYSRKLRCCFVAAEQLAVYSNM